MIILPTAYLGNIQYYSKLLSGDDVVIEQHENYQKQSYRTRCDILGANGIISLTIPVIKMSGQKTPIREVRIDNSKKWQHQHWISIMSAYKGSPYFDYFADEIKPFYDTRYELLWDFNLAIGNKVLEILELNPEVKFSGDYIKAGDTDLDFRDSLSPKPRLHIPDNEFSPRPYYQVFSDKFGFIPNLSIIDLLFCEGMEAPGIIKASSKRPGEKIRSSNR